jgi:tRNA (mo5U34)-methyltransferase
MTAEQTRKSISHINWFHRIDLGHGVVTPGDDDSSSKLKKLRIPQDLSGKTFLDIGAWDGFFSFEAEKRGASRVLAIDSYVWDGKCKGKSKEGFLAARSILNSQVEDMHLDAFDISPERLGEWDVVLLAGVLYHVKHPWLLIEKAASVARQLLIVETAIDLRFLLRPAVAFYQSSQFEKSHVDNWCAPNIPGLRTMLLNCGFSKIEVVHKSGAIRAAFSSLRRLFRYGYSPLVTIQQGRCAVHARR